MKEEFEPEKHTVSLKPMSRFIKLADSLERQSVYGAGVSYSANLSPRYEGTRVLAASGIAAMASYLLKNAARALSEQTAPITEEEFVNLARSCFKVAAEHAEQDARLRRPA